IPHLSSTTCFGDNLEDEWFIVYIVLEITKVYQNLIVQLEDNDGDFMLIEAADYLPAWANPDTTENRVFLQNKQIHIIPPDLAATNSNLNVADAINLVAQNPNITKAPEEIQNAILRKVEGYPQKIHNNCHNAILKLPLEIAAVISLEPTLISPIVHTYCNLDALEARQCKDIKFDNCVNVKVKFTKYLYAMLLHSPLLSTIKYKVLESDKKGQMGLKIASSYNIILKQSCGEPFSTMEYQRFIESLSKNGYFKDNLEGSVHYKQLLEKANSYFLNMESPITSNACHTIENIKSTSDFENMKTFLRNESDSGVLEDDDASWLTIDPDELNNLLNYQYGKKGHVKNETVTPHLITSELSSFLKKTSDYEGIEQVNDDVDSDDGDIDFDCKEFVTCIEKMLKIVTNDEETNCDDQDISGDDYSDTERYEFDTNQDLELAAKLKTSVGENLKDDKSVVNNLVQSIKEEGLCGPSSVVLRTIGIKKSDVLDSDDDDE
ncbi:putative SGT1 protein ecdysoneless, partial [Danaus plexippus plexippus]